MIATVLHYLGQVMMWRNSCPGLIAMIFLSISYSNSSHSFFDLFNENRQGLRLRTFLK